MVALNLSQIDDSIMLWLLLGYSSVDTGKTAFVGLVAITCVDAKIRRCGYLSISLVGLVVANHVGNAWLYLGAFLLIPPHNGMFAVTTEF